MAREYKMRPPESAAPTQKVSGDTLLTWGKHGTPPTRYDDVPADYWAWVWSNFLHRQPEKSEHQYIVQNIEALDKDTQSTFVPDPRKFRK